MDTKKTKQPVDQPKKQMNNTVSLQKKIEELEQQLAEATHSKLRALADFQNLQKRTHEDQLRFAKLAAASLFVELLTPFDHLKMAAAHSKDQGIELVVRQFKQVFEQEGVKEIEAVGKPFDPKRMDAVEPVEGEKDMVMRVREPGYMLHDYVLKPARVEVGEGKEAKETKETKEYTQN